MISKDNIELLAGLIIFGIVLVLFLIISIIFLKGRGANLIAGYNTMPIEDKELYDSIKMCKFMGKALLVFSFLLLLIPISVLTEIYWLVAVFFIITLIGSFVLVGYANKGDRFKKTS